MADLYVRALAVHERIKRRRVEVLKHLGALFYNPARAVLSIIQEQHDPRGVFADDPSGLPGYVMNVRTPMWWKRIARKLERYDYKSVDAFVSDMRLVIDNSFEYNGKRSEIAALTRRVEIAMETLFVEKLGLAPVRATEIVQLGTGLVRSKATEVWAIVCQYEGYAADNKSMKVSLQPAKLHNATRRRIVQYLNDVLSLQSATAAPLKQSAAPAPPPAPAMPQLQAPPQRQVRAPGPVARASPVPPANDVRHLMPDDDEVSFHQEEKPPPTLEPVPQNQRGDMDVFAGMSPIHMDDSDDEMMQ